MPIPVKWPVQPITPGNKSEIIIMGQRFALAGDTPVVAYDQPDAYSFYATDSPDGNPMFGDRYEKPGLKVTTMEQLVTTIHQMVIHTDLTQDSAGCFRALVGRSLSTHFMVDWDGTLWQPLDVADCGYHAGDANQRAIGLDMNNRLPNLEREPNEKPYDSNHPRFAEQSLKKYNRPISDRMEINGSKVKSYGYTDPQYSSLIELLKVLTKRFKSFKAQYPIDAKGDVVTRTMDDAASFDGFMAHWHWEAQRWDPGPGFDFARVFAALGSEFNSFPIEVTEGKNIKSLLEPTKVKEYAEEYYHNNETTTQGWYPMGINQTWHGGIHLSAPEDKHTAVRAMTDGVLVAARFGKQPTKLGNNNFIVIKHTVNIPAKKKGVEGKKFVFFSLYMHLEPLDVTKVTETSPNWLREMYRIDSGKTAEEEEALEKKPGEDDDDKTPKPDKKADPAEEEEDPLDPDAFDPRGYLDIGQHLTALKAGNIAKIAYADDPININSGEILGYVGKFGNPGDWKRQVHVEVFADTGWKDAIDIGVHGRFLSELDDDVGEDLYVENPDILDLFGPPKKVAGLNPKRTLDPSSIEYFWASDTEFIEEKRYLQKAVVRHVSEWSDKVDWVSALSAGESWDDKVADFKKILRGNSLGKDAISTVLPFIWLSKDMAEHMGIDVKEWRGLLDHFHPIHFLMWLTYNSAQRVQVISSGVSKKAAVKKAREEAAAAEAARKNGAISQNEGSETTIIEFLDGADIEDAGAILEPFKNGRGQGEWKPPEPVEE